MSPVAFQTEVCRRAARGFEHMIAITEHAAARMVERDVTRRMVLTVLRGGDVVGTDLKWDADHANWVAPIVGVAAGMGVTAVCALRDGDVIVTVVTAYGTGAE